MTTTAKHSHASPETGQGLTQRVRDSHRGTDSRVTACLDIIVLCEPMGIVTSISPSILPALGYSPEELAGRSLLALSHPDDQSLLRELFTEAGQAASTSVRVCCRLWGKDETWRWFEASATYLPDAPGAATLVVTLRELPAQQLAPRWQESELRAPEHFVQFYETDDFLIASLGAFVRAGLQAGEACLVIATPTHRQQLEAYLDASDGGLALAREQGRYIALDAEKTLAKFMAHGSPEPKRFAEVVGQVLMRAADGQGHIRIFGEMVALLWAAGQREAAIRLEELWNEIHQRIPDFSLFCAYPMQSFAGEAHGERFSEICRLHAHVLPDESYTALTSADERLRAISLLQQKAGSLQAEIEMRQGMEERLRVSENRYRRLFEASTDGILIVAADSYVIADANRVMSDLLGYPHTELLGRPLWRVGLFPDQEATQHALGDLREGDSSKARILPLRAKDGQMRFVELVSNRYRANGHEVLQCNLRDITERTRLERESSERASQFEAILESMVDGVLLYDAEARIVHVNRSGQRLMGYSERADFYQRPPVKRAEEYTLRDEHGRPVPEDQLPPRRILRGEVLTGLKAQDYQVRALDGRSLVLNLSGAPIVGHDGHIKGAVIVARDVGERHRLQERTRASLGALLDMAEALVQPPVRAEMERTDDAQRTTWAMWEDPSAQRLADLTRQVLGCQQVALAAWEREDDLMRPVAAAGLAPHEARQWWLDVQRTRITDFLDPASLARLQMGEVVSLDLAGAPPIAAQHYYGFGRALVAPLRIGERLVGNIALDFGVAPQEYSDEEIGLVSAVAKLAALVVQRERLMRERASAQAKVLALETTNQRMSEFLSIASHELRTPVTVIKTNIEMLTRRAERAMTAEAAQDSALARQLYMLQLTGRQVQRLTRLIADLLDITRMREGRFELCPEVVDVAEITREAVESQRLAHPQRLIRLLVPEAATALVRADADRMCQAVENYVTNALKYSPPSAPVSVTVRVIDGHCRVSVSDRGQSIPREEQEHIWELFHRAAGVKVQSGSGIGVGIGLYITRAIIERSGGRVGVRSVPGKGSTFWFTLPLARDAAES